MTADFNDRDEHPQQRAPSGADGRGEKTVAPAGSGATSDEDADTELKAAREAGEYAAAVADVDPEEAAPIPRDAKEALADENAASSAPADSDRSDYTLSREADSGDG